jgi:hypothetical protein
MLRKAVRFQLHFGPYRTPRFRYGSTAKDEIRGEVKVVGMTNARIPWAIGLRGRARALVMSGALARAIHRESCIAVAYWWGVTAGTVRSWRRLLGVSANTDGTHRLRSAYGETPANIRKLRRGYGTQRKILTGQALSKQTRQKISQTFKRLGLLPPAAVGRVWSVQEDEWARTRSCSEVMRKTGRSATAVYSRRVRLKRGQSAA